MANNFKLDPTEQEMNTRDEDIMEALATTGLEDMVLHFLPQRKLWSIDGHTWSMLCGYG